MTKRNRTTNKALLRGVAVVLSVCVLTGLSACAAGPVLPPQSRVSPTDVTAAAVPCIDNTVLHNGKTLYEYYSENNDTIGWLTIDGILTDNVVMLGQDKPYERGDDGINHYLNYDFSHQPSRAGELYIDARCRITYNSMSQNMTVYGHHMRNGTMLAGLDYYVKESYFQDHQYMTFQTLWHTYHFRVFGVFIVNLKVKSDAAFNYRRPEFKSEQAFLDFIDEVRERSFYDTGVTVQGTDRILTLSTCTYPTGNSAVDNARLVVMARQCTPEEEAALQSDAA